MESSVFGVACVSLNCSTWDLVPWPAVGLSPLPSEHRVLATGSPGKSHIARAYLADYRSSLNVNFGGSGWMKLQNSVICFPNLWLNLQNGWESAWRKREKTRVRTLTPDWFSERQVPISFERQLLHSLRTWASDIWIPLSSHLWQLVSVTTFGRKHWCG